MNADLHSRTYCANDDYGGPRFLAADSTVAVGSDGTPVTSSPSGNPFLFHGMEWDAETALYYGGGEELPRNGKVVQHIQGL